jgi:phage baseplate assembly protein V
MRASDDYRKNAAIKRGIVVDRDPKRMRVKVRFADEDDTVSYWIDVLSPAAGPTSGFTMPELNNEVWCGGDLKGEDGCLIGAKYNDKDKPPFEGNDDMGLTFPGGSIHVDRASGAITINSNGTVRIKAAQIILEGEVHLGGEGGELVHRKGDADDAGDKATGSASKVYAV